MLEKIKNNKLLNIIGNIIYAIALLVIILILILVIIQRVSNNNAALGGIRIYSVITGSMIPRYEIGDILISKDINPEEIKIGDDITYKSKNNGKLITHSVVDIREEDGTYKFITRGIANTTDDPEISEEQIYGKVVYKTVLLSFINKIIRNVYAFYFLIIVPMAIIIARAIANSIIRREEEEEQAESISEKDLEEEKKSLESKEEKTIDKSEKKKLI